MSVEQLIADLDRLCVASGAIPVLRKFVFDAAVRGRLVPQLETENDPVGPRPAILHGWNSLFESGQTKSRKTTLSVVDDPPFPIPAGWTFTRLGDVLHMINGRAFKPTEWKTQGLPIVRIQNLNNPEAEFNYCDESIVDSRHQIDSGEFLISWSGTPGTSFGAFIWRHGKAALNQHIFRCIQVGDLFDKEFLRIAINAQLDVLIAKAQGAVGLQHITKGNLEQLPLVLPPLSEQRRIVKKVGELTKLLDELSEAQDDSAARLDQLVQAEATQLSELANSSKVLIDRNDAIHLLKRLLSRCSTTEHFKLFRKSLLNIAVHGILSRESDWSNDLPAVELGTIAKLQNGYAFKSEWYSGTGIRLLRNLNVGHRIARWDDTVCLPAAMAAAYERFQLADGDVVLSLDRPFINSGTKVAQIQISDLPCLLVQRVARITFDRANLLSEYLVNWIESPHFFNQVNPGSGSGVPHISSSQVEQAKIFVPSLEEQGRIVAKVKDLLSLCADLESEVATLQLNAQKLLERLIDDALGIDHKSQEIHSMAIPLEEAVAPLKFIAKESRFMQSSPVQTQDQLLSCLQDLGGEVTAETLFSGTGLTDDIEIFYDLIRGARDNGVIAVELGMDQNIRRSVDEN